MHLFVSYARPDRLRVDPLAARLRQAGFDIWLDSDLLGGQAWWDNILAALRSCDAVVATVSRASISSRACRAEREYATQLEKPILPILLENIAAGLLPADIAQLQFVDYTKPDEAAAFRLAGAIFALPRPRALPNPLPAPPAVPSTPFSNLSDRLAVPSLSLEEQLSIIGLLEEALSPDGDPDVRQTAAALLDELANRPDLYKVAAQEIQTLQAQARSAAPKTSQQPTPPERTDPPGNPGFTRWGSRAAEHGPTSAPVASSRIFLSYRRGETAYPSGWLYDKLAQHFGKGQVFKDIDSIQLGDDFVEVIDAAVARCDALLALIGPRWLTITDEGGRRRLDNPNDFVRLEIEAAITRNVRIIPILVEGARMPRNDELPPSLAKLARRHALELSPSHFDFDTSRLLDVLDRTLAGGQAPPVDLK